METLKRLSDIPPDDLAAVERMFGQRIASPDAAILILKTNDALVEDTTFKSLDRLPEWLNVLSGMSDQDLDELDTILKTPLTLIPRQDEDETSPA